MYHIICNLFSGRKHKKSKKIAKIFQYLEENKIEYQVYYTKYTKHPTELAREITTTYESGDLIVIGGDGTFNEVLNGISDLSKWHLGLIPTGSGNDLATNLNIKKKNYLECLKTILNGNLKAIDYIKVNDLICANVLGTGIDVEVLLNFEKHAKLKGRLRYFVSLIQTLFHLKWHEFDVSIDDGPFVSKKGLIIALCNGSNIGGGIQICPNAKTNDHQLEFVFVGCFKKRKLLGYLLKLLKGKIFSLKEAEHIYCKKAIFKDQKPLVLQIDGNITNNYNEYVCEIIEEGLNMYL